MSQTNQKTVQILSQFIDGRGNLYTPGIYKPGTLLEISLLKANYKILEDGESPVDIEENRVEIKPPTTSIKRNDPIQTRPPVEETPVTTQNIGVKPNQIKRTPKQTKVPD